MFSQLCQLDDQFLGHACKYFVLVKYTHLMKSTGTTACNLACNIMSTTCNYPHVITHIFMYLCVRWVDTACNVCV